MESKAVLGSLAVPCSPDFLPQVEEFCDDIITSQGKLEPDITMALQLAICETGRLGVSITPEGDYPQFTMITVSQHGDSMENLALKMVFPFEGLQVNCKYPPYPSHLAGLTFSLCSLFGEDLFVRVEGSDDAVIYTKKNSASFEEEYPAAHGNTREGQMMLTLLMLCRVWETVHLSSHPRYGSVLWLEHLRLPLTSHLQG